MTDAGCDRRWLLVLGSNVDAEQRLDDALQALARHAEVSGCSRRRWGDDIEGGRRPYLNQLVELCSPLSEQRLRAVSKQIETDAGRCAQRLATGLCDLDIDLLARLPDDGRIDWLAEKPRLIPAVAELLAERFGSRGDPD